MQNNYSNLSLHDLVSLLTSTTKVLIKLGKQKYMGVTDLDINHRWQETHKDLQEIRAAIREKVAASA